MGLPSYEVPEPVAVWSVLEGDFGQTTFYQNLMSSLLRLLAGYVIGGVLAIGLGMAAGLNRVIRN